MPTRRELSRKRCATAAKFFLPTGGRGTTNSQGNRRQATTGKTRKRYQRNKLTSSTRNDDSLPALRQRHGSPSSARFAPMNAQSVPLLPSARRVHRYSHALSRMRHASPSVESRSIRPEDSVTRDRFLRPG